MEKPSYFAGIIGMAGNPNNSNKEKLKQLKGVEVQFVVGDQDSYWMSSVKKATSFYKKLELKAPLKLLKMEYM